MTLERRLVADALPAYEIGEELGRGGWGVVLDARHRQLGRSVAIKQLPRAFAADPEVRSRFVAEARLLASLDHPHIVPVFDFVERDGLCLLVMEKLTGGTLWERFLQGGVTPPESCALVLAAAVALHHAHTHGVLHRDVKPENLMFSGSGILKVTDFGIAKVLAGGRTLATRAGEVLGTPAYMAPEQAMGDELGPGTDVYALGVVLYELLAGRLPFPPADSPMATLYQHVHADATPLHDVAPAVPHEVGAVVMACLSKDQRDRPANGEALAVALATASAESFGHGWLDRTGVVLMAASRVVAAAQRAGDEAAGSAVHRASGLRPTTVVEEPASRPATVLEPDELVPVSELTSTTGSFRALGAAMRRAATPASIRAAVELEQLESSAHDVRELRLLQQHRTDSPFRPEDAPAVERLLGALGTSPAARLGLPLDTGPDALRAEAEVALRLWKRRAESPLSSRELSTAARVLVRTCEGILARISA